MKHEKRIASIEFIRPNAQWVLEGDELIWLDEIQTKPTETEIQEGLVKLEQQEQFKIEQKVIAKAAAEAKLAKLGLTADDLQALGLA